MVYVTEPNEILVHFLRANLTDLVRYNPAFASRLTSATQQFNGTGSANEFTLTNIPDSITSVTADGVLQVPHLNYQIDLDNKKIKFNVGYIPIAGTNNITVVYKHGQSWIHPDKPREELKRSSYPRIGVIPINENSEDMGMGETDTYDTFTFQIDVVAYKDQLCTIGAEYKDGPDVVQYLARQVIKYLQENRVDLRNKLYNPVILNNFPTPFEDDKHIVRRIIELKLEANNAGR